MRQADQSPNSPDPDVVVCAPHGRGDEGGVAAELAHQGRVRRVAVADLQVVVHAVVGALDVEAQEVQVEVGAGGLGVGGGPSISDVRTEE